MEELIEFAVIIGVSKHLIHRRTELTTVAPIFTNFHVARIVVVGSEIVHAGRVVDDLRRGVVHVIKMQVFPERGNVVAGDRSRLAGEDAANRGRVGALGARAVLGAVAQVIESTLVHEMLASTHLGNGGLPCQARLLAARLRIRCNLFFISLGYMRTEMHNKFLALLEVRHAINATPNASRLVIENRNENLGIEIERVRRGVADKRITGTNKTIAYWGRRG